MKTHLFARVAAIVVLTAAFLMSTLTAGAATELPVPALANSLRPPTADVLRSADCADLPAGLAAPAACVRNQAQWLWNMRSDFGNVVKLRQGFKVTTQSRLCKIEVRIRKYTATPPANAVTLSVRTAAGALVDSATIAGGAIPLGDSTQTFNMNCDGGAVAPGNLYYMVLESPTSTITAAYAWYAQAGNPYPSGQGERKVGAGAWGAIGGDFAFRVYLCN